MKMLESESDKKKRVFFSNFCITNYFKFTVDICALLHKQKFNSRTFGCNRVFVVLFFGG